MPKILFTLSFVFYLLPSCFSQRIFYSNEIIKSYQSKYSIIGNIKDNILVWTGGVKKGDSEVWIFDNNMNLIKKVEENSFDSPVELNFFTDSNHYFLASQQISNKQRIFKVAVFDDMANKISEIKLDSIGDDVGGGYVFNYLQSPDKKTICLVKRELVTAKNILKVDCYFTDGKTAAKKSFGLPFNQYTDYISDIAIDEKENVYLLKIKMEAGASGLQLYKGAYEKSAMLWAEKEVKGLVTMEPKMLVKNNVCLVYGVYIPVVNTGMANLLNTRQVYFWRTNYNMQDAPGDSLYSFIKGIAEIENVPPLNAPGNFFYAFGDVDTVKRKPTTYFLGSSTTVGNAYANDGGGGALMFDPSAMPQQYSNYSNQFNSGRMSGTPVFINDGQTTSSVWQNMRDSRSSNFSPNNVKMPLSSIVPYLSLHIFSVDSGNEAVLTKSFQKDSVYSGSIFGAKIIRKAGITHIVFNVANGKKKNSIQYFLLKDDGEITEVPVNAWNARYRYDFSRASVLEDGLLIPCYKDERITFVKMNLKN